MEVQKCGYSEFKEVLSQAETIGGTWNRDGEHEGYGVEIIAIEEIVCCGCEHSERSGCIEDIAEWVEEEEEEE